jgi:uncharacterized membrane protein YGL010W
MTADTTTTKTMDGNDTTILTSKSTEKQMPFSFSLIIAHLFCALISFLIIKSFFDFQNAQEALGFYGVYHQYGWNQVVHFFGVPGIVWSMLLLFIHIKLPFIVTSSTSSSSTKSNNNYSSLNYASFIAICYNLFYAYIDPIGAVLYGPIIYMMYVSAYRTYQNDQQKAAAAAAVASSPTKDNSKSQSQSQSQSHYWYGTGKPLKIALFVHIFCWYIQIHLGHQIIEGAQPAVLKSVGGALSVAPLFAFYEGLWYIGINTSLQESTKLLVEEYTKEVCNNNNDDTSIITNNFMKICSTLATTYS